MQHPGSPALIAPTPFLAPAPMPIMPYHGYGGICYLPDALAHQAMARPMGIHPGEGMHAIPAFPSMPQFGKSTRRGFMSVGSSAYAVSVLSLQVTSMMPGHLMIYVVQFVEVG